jgi:peptidoglycan/LPS O-acetylase OafA/YrhL
MERRKQSRYKIGEADRIRRTTNNEGRTKTGVHKLLVIGRSSAVERKDLLLSEVLPTAAAPEKRGSPPLRLDYLDGLRGLAALYVVMHHAFMQSTHAIDRINHATPLVRNMKWLDYGHYAVAIFIVLSGYCLMLPVARTADGALRGGFVGYIQRRAKRILPPYYAALLLTLALVWFVPGLSFYDHVHWDVTLPAFEPESIGAHLLLLHNLKKEWIYNISHPLWSVATEWQIYFLFPMFLFFWRRLGNIALLVAAFAFGLIPYFAAKVIVPKYAMELACPWFIVLFGLGMLGAAVGFSPKPAVARLRTAVPWGVLSVALTAAFILLAAFWRTPAGVPATEDWNVMWAMDALVGAATMCLIIFCTRAAIEREATRWPLALRILNGKFAVSIGAFSYSLYLVHAPLVAWMHLHLRATNLSETAVFWIMLLAGVPLISLACWLFYLVCERPFVSNAHGKKKASTPPTAAAAPAEVSAG